MSVHGTARFATRPELERAGLLPPGTPSSGLTLGSRFEDRYDF
jgi:hypothetical protein